jgi:hypothetical protein
MITARKLDYKKISIIMYFLAMLKNKASDFYYNSIIKKTTDFKHNSYYNKNTL